MIVDLEEREESGRFDLEGGGWMELRLVDPKEATELRKACDRTKAEYPLLDGKRQRFEVPDFDIELFTEMVWDKTIKGYGDIFDRSGCEIPVTKENKVLLMNKVKKFADVYTEGMKALKESWEKRAEQAEKN